VKANLCTYAEVGQMPLMSLDEPALCTADIDVVGLESFARGTIQGHEQISRESLYASAARENVSCRTASSAIQGGTRARKLTGFETYDRCCYCANRACKDRAALTVQQAWRLSKAQRISRIRMWTLAQHTLHREECELRTDIEFAVHTDRMEAAEVRTRRQLELEEVATSNQIDRSLHCDTLGRQEWSHRQVVGCAFREAEYRLRILECAAREHWQMLIRHSVALEQMKLAIAVARIAIARAETLRRCVLELETAEHEMRVNIERERIDTLSFDERREFTGRLDLMRGNAASVLQRAARIFVAKRQRHSRTLLVNLSLLRQCEEDAREQLLDDVVSAMKLVSDQDVRLLNRQRLSADERVRRTSVIQAEAADHFDLCALELGGSEDSARYRTEASALENAAEFARTAWLRCTASLSIQAAVRAVGSRQEFCSRSDAARTLPADCAIYMAEVGARRMLEEADARSRNAWMVPWCTLSVHLPQIANLETVAVAADVLRHQQQTTATLDQARFETTMAHLQASAWLSTAFELLDVGRRRLVENGECESQSFAQFALTVVRPTAEMMNTFVSHTEERLPPQVRKAFTAVADEARTAADELSQTLTPAALGVLCSEFSLMRPHDDIDRTVMLWLKLLCPRVSTTTPLQTLFAHCSTGKGAIAVVDATLQRQWFDLPLETFELAASIRQRALRNVALSASSRHLMHDLRRYLIGLIDLRAVYVPRLCIPPNPKVPRPPPSRPATAPRLFSPARSEDDGMFKAVAAIRGSPVYAIPRDA
jgi:hypothetical protein